LILIFLLLFFVNWRLGSLVNQVNSLEEAGAQQDLRIEELRQMLESVLEAKQPE